jgi:ABC-type nickel/cobalt efflux system permease component RcnA
LPQETETAALWAGRVSFGLLTIVGLYVFARAAATLADGVRQWRHDARDLHHDHAGHAHGEGCGRAAVRCWC